MKYKVAIPATIEIEVEAVDQRQALTLAVREANRVMTLHVPEARKKCPEHCISFYTHIHGDSATAERAKPKMP